jgi:hypothetical protein
MRGSPISRSSSGRSPLLQGSRVTVVLAPRRLVIPSRSAVRVGDRRVVRRSAALDEGVEGNRCELVARAGHSARSRPPGPHQLLRQRADPLRLDRRILPQPLADPILERIQLRPPPALASASAASRSRTALATVSRAGPINRATSRCERPSTSTNRLTSAHRCDAQHTPSSRDPTDRARVKAQPDDSDRRSDSRARQAVDALRRRYGT